LRIRASVEGCSHGEREVVTSEGCRSRLGSGADASRPQFCASRSHLDHAATTVWRPQERPALSRHRRDNEILSRHARHNYYRATYQTMPHLYHTPTDRSSHCLRMSFLFSDRHFLWPSPTSIYVRPSYTCRSRSALWPNSISEIYAFLPRVFREVHGSITTSACYGLLP
jgi:hypothetical protein